MKYSIFVITFFCASMVFAQTLVASFKPVDSKYDCGYLDPTGKILIEPSYKGAFDFSENGIASVFDLKTKTWYYITLDNEKIDVKLEKFEPNSILGYGRTGFNGKTAIVVAKKKKGVIGTDGKVIHQPKYDFISKFENGIGTAKIGSDFFILKEDGDVIKLKQPMIEIKSFQEGLVPFKVESGLFGYLDTFGEVVIKPQFKSAHHFYDGIAMVKSESGLVGYINKKGEWVIEAKYLTGKKMVAEDKIARVKTEEGWFYVKSDGTEVKIDGAVGLGDFHEGMAYVRIGKMFGFVNANGEWVIEPKFVKVKSFSDGLAAVRTGEQWGFINKKGEFVFKEQAKAIRNFKNGYAAVANDKDLWGVINKKGEWVIDPIYDHVKDFYLVK